MITKQETKTGTVAQDVAWSGVGVMFTIKW